MSVIDSIIEGKLSGSESVQVLKAYAGDIAEVVARVLIDDSYNGEIIEVTGPELITFKDIVDIISSTSNRNISFHSITLELYIEGMKQMQIPTDVVWLIEYLFRHVLTNPKNQVVVNDVERVLGRKARTFKEYAIETAKTGIWSQVEGQ